jgi:hypothetical protein
MVADSERLREQNDKASLNKFIEYTESTVTHMYHIPIASSHRAESKTERISIQNRKPSYSTPKCRFYKGPPLPIFFKNFFPQNGPKIRHI